MSRVSAIFHIIINTHNRELTIDNLHKEDLYRYMWKVLTNKGCVLYRINGIENHIHLLIDLKKDLSLSELMRELKKSSSQWAKTSGLFPRFKGWGKEYAAFSVSYEQKNYIIDYIKAQQEHHRSNTLENELKRIYAQAGLFWGEYD